MFKLSKNSIFFIYFTLVIFFYILASLYPAMYEVQFVNDPLTTPGVFHPPSERPDVFCFYLWLFSLGVTGLVNDTKKGRHFLRTSVKVMDTYTCYGEILLLSSIALLTIVWFCTFYPLFNDEEYFAAQFAKTIGHLMDLFYALLLLPQSRYSFWETMLNRSYEENMKYHRWAGYIAFGLTCIHFLIWNIHYIDLQQWDLLFTDGPEVNLETGEPCTFGQMIAG